MEEQISAPSKVEVVASTIELENKERARIRRVFRNQRRYRWAKLFYDETRLNLLNRLKKQEYYLSSRIERVRIQKEALEAKRKAEAKE